MKQAIALAGGGTKGAYQVGAWKAMRELGIPFDIVTGTSIGSVTAALMVQGDFDRAWELWTHITEEQIMLERADATPHEKRELAALAEHPEQLIARVKDWADLNRRTADITPYCALVHQYLDEARFFASPVDFGLMTARFPSFQPVEVRKQDIAPGYLPQWILASSACYPMFPMCEIDGQNYLDGAYSDNLPIGTAFRLGADRVIAIGLKPETPEKKYTNHPLVTYIAPAEPLGKLLEFDPDALRHSIALGYTDTLRVLGSHIGHTYTFEPDGQTLLEGVARDYLLWLLRRELTPPDSMLDFFRSDTPLTDRILSDQRSDLTARSACSRRMPIRAGRSTISSSCCRSWPCALRRMRTRRSSSARTRCARRWAASISSRSSPRSRRATTPGTSSSPHSRSICASRRPDGQVFVALAGKIGYTI